MGHKTGILVAAALCTAATATASAQSPSDNPARIELAAYEPFAPRSSAAEIIPNYINTLEKHCSSNPAEAVICRVKEGVSDYRQVAGLLAQIDNNCDEPARAYLNALKDCNDPAVCGRAPTPTAAVAYDDECLFSFTPWQVRGGIRREAATPDVFVRGGENGQSRGALDATVLIELEINGRRYHHCTGLLQNGNSVLTARHCFARGDGLRALRKNRVFGRIIGRPGGQASADFGLRATEKLTAQDDPPVEEDYMELRVDGPAVTAPRVTFGSISGPEEAVVVSHFVHWSRSRTNAADGLPEWRQGLRWPRSRMCYAIRAVSNCLRMLCQTIHGYSGAPVFSLNSRPGEPLRVLGIVSGADVDTAKCGFRMPGATLAAVVPLAKKES